MFSGIMNIMHNIMYYIARMYAALAEEEKKNEPNRL